MTTISNDIIIAGAGPTGLMMANQLTRMGIDYIILDQKPGPTDQSRALIVHSRSMEIYQQLGLSDKVIAEGQRANGLMAYTQGKVAATLDLSGAGENTGPFPYIMMYEQNKNETLLYTNLLEQHRSVQWNTTIISIKKEQDQYTLQARHNDIDITYQCTYLIACDGGKSIVRDFSQIPFTGGTYMNVFYVVDTHVKAGLDSAKLSVFLTPKAVAMLFPMKGENHFRTLGILPKEYYHRDDIPFEEVLDVVKKDMKIPVEFYDTGWHSTYKLHHKKVVRFSKDNIFFAGDAAHVHSPAGGQGMNTGLQDASNLAWKLALVKKGKAAPSLLNTYHEERNPVAEDLLQTTDRLFSAMITDSASYAFLRVYLVPFFIRIIGKLKFVRKQLFVNVSQIKISYVSSSLSKGKAGRIRSGMRCPYFFVTQGGETLSIYDLIKQKAVCPFTVLLYNVSTAGFAQLDKEMYNLVPIEVNRVNDKTMRLTGLTASFVIVVRPDNYIGYMAEKANVPSLDRFMRTAYYFV